MTKNKAEILGGTIGKIVGTIVGILIGLTIGTAAVYFVWNYGVVSIWSNLPQISITISLISFLAFRIIVSLIKAATK